MSRRLEACRAALLLALAGGSCWIAAGAQAQPAQQPPPPAVPVPASVDLADGLSENEAVTLALAADPERKLRAGLAREQAARSKGEADAAWANPELRLQHWKVWESTPVKPQKYAASLFDGSDVTLRWHTPSPGRGSALAEAGGQRARAEAAAVARERQKLSVKVRGLYLRLLGIEAQQKVAGEGLALRQRLAELSRTRVAAGSGTALEQSLADLDAWDALAGQQKLDLRHQRLWQELASLTGLPADPPLPLQAAALEATCALPPALADTTALSQQARQQRQDLLAMQHRVASAQAEVDAVSRARLFWPSWAEARYSFGNPGNVDALMLGVAFPLPLLDWKSARLEQKAALQAERQALLEARRREVDGEVQQALAQLRERQAALATYDQARPAVEAAMAQISQAISAGQSDLLHLAAVKGREAQLRRARIEAQVACQQAVLAVELAVGAP